MTMIRSNHLSLWSSRFSGMSFITFYTFKNDECQGFCYRNSRDIAGLQGNFKPSWPMVEAFWKLHIWKVIGCLSQPTEICMWNVCFLSCNHGRKYPKMLAKGWRTSWRPNEALAISTLGNKWRKGSEVLKFEPEGPITEEQLKKAERLEATEATKLQVGFMCNIGGSWKKAN